MTLTTDTVPAYPILYGMGDTFLNPHPAHDLVDEVYRCPAMNRLTRSQLLLISDSLIFSTCSRVSGSSVFKTGRFEPPLPAPTINFSGSSSGMSWWMDR
jgi:hypothetical protein